MLRGSRPLAGLLAVVAILALSCEKGASPGPSPTAESETATAAGLSPTALGETATAAPTVVPSPTVEGAGGPVVPDPFELYVMKADGSERRLVSSSPGSSRLVWSPAGGRAVVRTIISSEKTELRMITTPDGATQASVVVDGDVTDGWGSMNWSPTGVWLAYIRSSQKRAVLEVIRDDGSGREELTASEGDVQGISIAGWTKPDALVATRWDGSQSVIMEFNLTTGERREVATLAGKSYAAMSNDGTTVAATVSAPGKSCERGSPSNTLWLVDVATGQSRRAVGETCYLDSLAWSPDDGLIAYGVAPEEDPDVPPGVYVLDVASSTTRSLGGPGHFNDAVLNWLGDGSGVLVRRFDCYGCTPGAPSLLYMPVAGGGEQLVVDKAYFAVSPDHRNVVLAKDGLQVSGIFGGTTQTLEPSDPDWTLGFMSDLGWSPDGEWVNFVRYHSYVVRQFEVNADGTGLTRLANLDKPPTPVPAGPTARVPSPDGSKVAVLQFRLAIEDAQTGQSVTVDGSGTDDASWSPDGERLVFSSRSGYWQPDIYVVDASGAGLRQLTNDPDSKWGATFSPDGSEVAFVRRRGEEEQVVATNVESGEERLLFASETDGGSVEDHPVWSPDGKLVAILMAGSDGLGIYMMKADGTGAGQVVADTCQLSGMRWETPDRLYFVTWPEFGA